MDAPLDPVEALREVAYLLERAGGQTRRAQAFRRAAATIADLEPADRVTLAASGAWQSLPGVGATTGRVAAQATAGRVPDYLASLRDAARPLAEHTGLLGALRGDLHVHSEWSDGCCPVEEMMTAARARGSEYCAITDHSPHLTVAHGLDADRLAAQRGLVERLDEGPGGFRVLAGAEVDILADGTLDLVPGSEHLDVVVASVHSHLRMDADTMTRRMVRAIAHPRTTVLGHCTGRLVTGDRGTRPPSHFDAEVVFEACRQFGVAVEINSRPERQDPPDDLLTLAVEIGCLFAVNTDAHAPGQLEFAAYGALRGHRAGLTPQRVVNTWPVEELLAWTLAKRGA